MPVGVKCTYSYVKRNFSIIKLFSEIRWKLKQFLYSMYNFNKVMKMLFLSCFFKELLWSRNLKNSIFIISRYSKMSL